jgi:hypothetical protein
LFVVFKLNDQGSGRYRIIYVIGQGDDTTTGLSRNSALLHRFDNTIELYLFFQGTALDRDAFNRLGSDDIAGEAQQQNGKQTLQRCR